MSALKQFKIEYGNTPSAINAEKFLKKHGITCNLTIINCWFMWYVNKSYSIKLSEVQEIIDFVCKGKK